METKDTELPNERAFVRLLKVAQEVKGIIFYDASHGVESDYGQFLTDIMRTRKLLRESIPDIMFDQRRILRGEAPYVFLLTDRKYDYTVGALAILSVGGAFIPLRKLSSEDHSCSHLLKFKMVSTASDAMPEEVQEIIRRSKSRVVLASDTCLSVVGDIRRHGGLHDLQILSSQICVNVHPTLDGGASSIGIDENARIPAERPSMIFFTSGTSGPPKGVVHTRKLFNTFGSMTGPGDVVLHHQNPSWIGGAIPLLRNSLAGARIEVISSDPAVLWKRLRLGGVTMLAGNPRIWNGLMRYFKRHLCSLPSEELNQYIAAARNIRVAKSGGMVPCSSLIKFWREEIGLNLKTSYGSTELGGRGLCTSPDTDVKLPVRLPWLRASSLRLILIIP
jgi:malonyl-CoA/methylmalonyl-CoA synthetase